MAVDWSKEQGYQYLKIECQNTNLPACRFYEKHGAELIVVNEHAYGNGEVMFLWYLSL
jgi:ribosomal protein S18 acetylase RimI-like enzyme